MTTQPSARREGDQWRVILPKPSAEGGRPGRVIVVVDASEAETQAEAIELAKKRLDD